MQNNLPTAKVATKQTDLGQAKINKDAQTNFMVHIFGIYRSDYIGILKL